MSFFLNLKENVKELQEIEEEINESYRTSYKYSSNSDMKIFLNICLDTTYMLLNYDDNVSTIGIYGVQGTRYDKIGWNTYPLVFLEDRSGIRTVNRIQGKIEFTDAQFKIVEKCLNRTLDLLLEPSPFCLEKLKI